MAKELTPRNTDYSQWYNELVGLAGLAEHAAVRGCMVIKPYGYSIWENMQAVLDTKFKETGHLNAYFPLLIPKSFFSKEASHVKGFAKECAVVTHYRLKNGPDGEIIVDEEAKLDEELIIRPTSETTIWNTYKGWIESYRDLPLLVNQWANVVRWEMRTRLFLRTSEFLWQEGHTAHATAEEALAESRLILDIYAEFAEEWMAMPVIKGVKTESERFGGAEETYAIEALMQDGKALQAGTSHFLGQNFAKAFDVRFTGRDGKQDYVWATSWGVSTRLMGALVMSHSDDQGLVLPPKLAPIQVVLITVHRSEEELDTLNLRLGEMAQELKSAGIRVHRDKRDDLRPGFKYAEWEMKGVPIRLSLGMRDLNAGTAEIARRDTKEKLSIPLSGLANRVSALLDQIQQSLFSKALAFRDENTTVCDDYLEFQRILDEKGGFILAHWDGKVETEQRIKDETKATIRCIPLSREAGAEEGNCILTGQPSEGRVVFARAY